MYGQNQYITHMLLIIYLSSKKPNETKSYMIMVTENIH